MVARERLCRYLLRPPISDDRLTMMPDGKIALALKTPWRDGTVGIVLTAIQLVAKLAALVARPGQNLIPSAATATFPKRGRPDVSKRRARPRTITAGTGPKSPTMGRGNLCPEHDGRASSWN